MTTTPIHTASGNAMPHPIPRIYADITEIFSTGALNGTMGKANRHLNMTQRNT